MKGTGVSLNYVKEFYNFKNPGKLERIVVNLVR